MDLAKTVAESLDIAVKENTYDFEGQSALEIARDILAFDETHAASEHTEEDLLPHVEAWLRANPGATRAAL